MDGHAQHSLSKKQIISLGSVIFLLICSYAIVRPAVTSIFIQEHTSQFLPVVWLFTTIVTALVLWIYNRFNMRFDILKVFCSASLISVGILFILTLGYIKKVPYSAFWLYVWKDTYIVLLVEIYWSFTNQVFCIKKAKGTYGFFLILGSVGGLVGGFLVVPLTKWAGTSGALLISFGFPFIYTLIAFLVSQKKAPAPPPNPSTFRTDSSNSFVIVKHSPYLLLLLFLVVLVQINITLIDYEYNAVLETIFTDIDSRTQIMGLVHSGLDIAAILMQAILPLILSLFGVGSVMLSIPLALSACVFGFLVSPTLTMILLVKGASKSLDYSLFRACKEILYIPLNKAEKTKGKALIDIFSYRFAQGIASVLLLVLIKLKASPWILYFSMLVQIIWIVLAFFINRRYIQLTSDRVVQADEKIP